MTLCFEPCRLLHDHPRRGLFSAKNTNTLQCVQPAARCVCKCHMLKNVLSCLQRLRGSRKGKQRKNQRRKRIWICLLLRTSNSKSEYSFLPSSTPEWVFPLFLLLIQGMTTVCCPQGAYSAWLISHLRKLFYFNAILSGVENVNQVIFSSSVLGLEV